MPFYQKPSFQIAALALILAGSYGFTLLTGGNVEGTLTGIAFDLLLLLLLSQLFLFFYAQFILPVCNASDRRTAFLRLLLHSQGAHGPVAFVQNGRVLERRLKGSSRNPGLLWLDSASAVVTRAGNGTRRALGPGIHFVGSDERISSTFSLHAQRCLLGPASEDPVFEGLPDDASEEERRRYVEAQATRMAVAGRTRDGNEVVPEISVVFKLDAMPAGPGVPGSRFGYFKEAVERAARGEGVAAGTESEGRSHVAWNQLPGLVAVDLWREYLSKFTLDELFTPGFPAIPDILQPQAPIPAPSTPAQPIGATNPLALLLRRLNEALERSLDQHGISEELSRESPHRLRQAATPRTGASQNPTALQIIARMMNERMTKAVVPVLDECGRLMKGHAPSEEFSRLKERGLAILDVRISSVRFDPAVEDQIVEHWNTGWMVTAAGDRRRVDQLELLAAQAGKQRALLEHTNLLGRGIHTTEPKTVASAVRTLLRSSQNEILSDERLHGRGGDELEALSELLRWVESGEHE